jgi:predicted nuclease of restriction endonuclease-like (RecB) superfamily
MRKLLKKDTEYADFIRVIKNKVQSAQIKAAVSVNRELIALYWEMAEKIVEKQKNSQWGDGLLAQMSKDLQEEFPDTKGFSLSNLKYMRQWFLFWNDGNAIGQQAVSQSPKSQQAVGQLEKAKQLATQIPWGHNLLIISKCKDQDEALFYAQKTIGNNWSRSVLTHHVVEYSLKDMNKPIGVSEYQITHALPEELKSSLPSIEEIEAEIGGGE